MASWKSVGPLTTSVFYELADSGTVCSFSHKDKKVRTGKRGNWISEHDAGFIFVTLFHLPWRQRPFERGWKIAKNADPSDYHQLHPRDSFPDLTWRWVEKALSFNKEEAGATGVLFVSYTLCYTHEVMQRVIQNFAGYKVSYLQWHKV